MNEKEVMEFSVRATFSLFGTQLPVSRCRDGKQQESVLGRRLWYREEGKVVRKVPKAVVVVFLLHFCNNKTHKRRRLEMQRSLAQR